MLLLGDLNSSALSPQLDECRLLQSFTSNFGLRDMYGRPTPVLELLRQHFHIWMYFSVFLCINVIVLPVGFSNHHVVVGTYLTR